MSEGKRRRSDRRPRRVPIPHLYIDFGHLAVALPFFFLGGFSRRPDMASVRTFHTASFLQVVLRVAAIYQLIFQRGSLLPMIGPIAFLLGFALFFSTKQRVDGRVSAVG